MTTITPSLAERNRAAAAVNLAARHLADRPGRHITARIIEGGLLVWKVESQTEPGKVHTVTREADGWPADTCDCEDHLWRHQRCKHQRAVDILIIPPAVTVTEAQADEIVLASKWADEVEESEVNELDFVYGLTDGSTVVVDRSGKLTHYPAQEQAQVPTPAQIRAAERVARDAAIDAKLEAQRQERRARRQSREFREEV